MLSIQRGPTSHPYHLSYSSNHKSAFAKNFDTLLITPFAVGTCVNFSSRKFPKRKEIQFYHIITTQSSLKQSIYANSMVLSEAEKSGTEKSAATAPGRDATFAKDETKDSEIVEMRPEHLFKHPLQNTWTLWYLESDRSKSWEELQNEITSFDTVEDFWSLYNHIKPPSEIKIGSDYSLFKKGIRPMWEDTGNKHGGRWMISLNRNHKPSDMDNLWLDVLLCLIGESFDHSDQICGAVINVRGKGNKISIWTADGNNKDAALEIGNKLRDALRLSRSNLQYQLHKDTMVKQGPSVKPIYTI